MSRQVDENGFPIVDDACMQCGTCKYHDNFSGACGNADSEHRADFTDNQDYCEGWSE